MSSKKHRKVVVPLEEAISENVRDGDTLSFASSGGRMSVACAHEIIRQKKRDLRFVSAGTGAPCLDLLVGARAVSRAEIAFTMVSLLNIRRILQSGGVGDGYRFELEDYSNLAMTLRFFAAATGVPFIPIRSLRGSDIERIRTFTGSSKMAVMRSPFEDGSEVAVLPPCRPDASIMHAQYADEEGNVVAFGPEGSDGWALRAARRRIVTVEKIVSTEFVRENRAYVFLPGFMVSALSEVRYGAHPWGLVDCYDVDEKYQGTYTEMSRTQEGFDRWADEWIFGVRDRSEYLRKVGIERLEGISKKEFLSRVKW